MPSARKVSIQTSMPKSDVPAYFCIGYHFNTNWRPPLVCDKWSFYQNYTIAKVGINKSVFNTLETCNSIA